MPLFKNSAGLKNLLNVRAVDSVTSFSAALFFIQSQLLFQFLLNFSLNPTRSTNQILHILEPLKKFNVVDEISLLTYTLDDGMLILHR